MRNIRYNKWYTFNGENLIETDLCLKYNMNLRTFRNRVKNGMSVEEALTIPLNTKWKNSNNNKI